MSLTGPHYKEVMPSPSTSTSTVSSNALTSREWEISAEGTLNRFLQHKARTRSKRSTQYRRSCANTVVSEGSTSTIQVSNIRHVRPMHDCGSTAGPSKPNLSETIKEENSDEGWSEDSDDDVKNVTKRPSPQNPVTSPFTSPSRIAPSHRTSHEVLTEKKSVPLPSNRLDAVTDETSRFTSVTKNTRRHGSITRPRADAAKTSTLTEADVRAPASSRGPRALAPSTNKGDGKNWIPSSAIQRTSGRKSSSSVSYSSGHSYNPRKVPVPHDSSDEASPNLRMSSKKKLRDQRPKSKHHGSGGIIGIHLATSFREGERIVGGRSVTSLKNRDNGSVNTQRTSRSLPALSTRSHSMPVQASPRVVGRLPHNDNSTDAFQRTRTRSARVVETRRVPAPDPVLDHAQPRRVSNQRIRSNFSSLVVGRGRL